MLCIKDVVKNEESHNEVLLNNWYKLQPFWLTGVSDRFSGFFFTFEETSQ
jgi:hypothetical protein